MGKIIKRISHFITKSIPMNVLTNPKQIMDRKNVIKDNQSEVQEVKEKESCHKKMKKQLIKSRNKSQTKINEESIYAGIPKKECSDIIERIKTEEIQKFRRITEIGRCRPKKINTVLVKKIVDSSSEGLRMNKGRNVT